MAQTPETPDPWQDVKETTGSALWSKGKPDCYAPVLLKSDVDRAKALTDQRHAEQIAALTQQIEQLKEDDGIEACAAHRRDILILQGELTALRQQNVGWRCFHCGMVLTSEQAAREHFGPAAGSGTVCALLQLRPIDVTTVLQLQDEREQLQARVTALSATVDRLQQDQQDWRKGVALIASALGDPADNLSCVRIAEIALTQRAEAEDRLAELTQLRQQLAEKEQDARVLRDKIAELRKFYDCEPWNALRQAEQQRDTLKAATVCLLYLLLRDAVPCGEMERLVSDVEKSAGKERRFSNPELAAIARQFVDRLATCAPETGAGREKDA